MQCSLVPGHAALAGLLASLLLMPTSLPAEEAAAESKKEAATSDDDLPQFTVRRAGESKEEPATTSLEASEESEPLLQFPPGQLPMLRRPLTAVLDGTEGHADRLHSNRRGGAWRQFWPQPQPEPGLFSVDEDRPLKPLTGAWAENPVWKAEAIDTWGVHPATPTPSHTPRLGLGLENLDKIIPVAGEEPLDAGPAKTACADKCAKCSKCDVCNCASCPGKDCQGEKKDTQLEQGETAKVILELMETLGRSVLDGTVFQKPDQADQQWLKELSADGQVSPREALIQYIRHLEAQQEQRTTPERSEDVELDIQLVSTPLRIKGPCSCPGECLDCPAECAECRECPAANLACHSCADKACHGCADSAPCLGDAAGNEVDVLREMSAHLEMAANELERREIYQRADQLREVAGQLRQDARRSSLARATHRSAPGLRPAQTFQDVHTELKQLREELRRTQAELEHVRGLRR